MITSHKLLLSSLAAVTSTTLTACLPFQAIDAPPAAGQVVSLADGRPVQGAVVTMTAGKAIARVRTDQTGSFRLPALQHFATMIVGAEARWANGTLRIEAAGYHPYTEHEVGFPNGTHGGPTKGYGSIEHGRTGPDLDHIHIALAPDA